MNIAWTRSRSKHSKQHEEAPENLKRLQIETNRLIPWNIPLDSVDFWFQDEARFDQQITRNRLCAMKHKRQRAVKLQLFEYVYLFWVVCTSTRKTEASLPPV